MVSKGGHFYWRLTRFLTPEARRLLHAIRQFLSFAARNATPPSLRDAARGTKLAQRRECFTQIARQRGDELHTHARRRMRQSQPLCVQGLPLEQHAIAFWAASGHLAQHEL